MKECLDCILLEDSLGAFTRIRVQDDGFRVAGMQVMALAFPCMQTIGLGLLIINEGM